MNTVQRLTKNISVLFLSDILGYIFAFFTLTYSARYLGVEGFGTLSLALAFAAVFTFFLDLGTDTFITREIARDYSLAEGYVANMIPLRIITSLVTLGLIFLISHIIHYNQDTIAIIMIIAVYTVFSTFSQLFFDIFSAYEKFEYTSVGFLLFNILLLGGILLAIRYGYNIIVISSVYVITGIIMLLYAYIICRWKFLPLNYSKWNKLINWRKWKELIKESLPFAITSMSFYIYTWADTLLLSILISTEVVGIYSAAYRLILIVLFIPGIFASAFFPAMSRFHYSSKDSLKIAFEKILKICILIAIPMAVGTTLIANKIILLIYGNAFLGSVIALQILIWSSVFTFSRTGYSNVMAASNMQLTVTKLVIVAVIFNIVLNLLVIPIYSYIGAAIVTVLTEALILILFVYTLKSEFSVSRSTKINLIKGVLASIIMGIAIYYFNNLNLFLIILLGALIYVVCLILLRVLDDDEILMIKSLFNRS